MLTNKQTNKGRFHARSLPGSKPKIHASFLSLYRKCRLTSILSGMIGHERVFDAPCCSLCPLLRRSATAACEALEAFQLLWLSSWG